MARNPKHKRRQKWRYSVSTHPPRDWGSKNWRDAKTWLTASRAVRACIKHQDFEWAEISDWRRRVAYRFYSPKLMKIHEEFDKFEAFAKTYWDLVPVKPEEMITSDYPTDVGVNAVIEWFPILNSDRRLEMLAALKKRSWHYLVDGTKTYDINAAIDEAIPNFDADPHDYIEQFVTRRFDTFAEAWPFWQKSFAAYLEANKENINELIRESKRIS